MDLGANSVAYYMSVAGTLSGSANVYLSPGNYALSVGAVGGPGGNYTAPPACTYSVTVTLAG
jgi:hypothetical protein